MEPFDRDVTCSHSLFAAVLPPFFGFFRFVPGCGANLDYRVFPVVDSAALDRVAGIAPASILSTMSSTATS